MVRGFILPLCAAIAPVPCRGLAASTLTGNYAPVRLRLSPIDRSKGSIELLTLHLTVDAADPAQPEVFFFFLFFFFLLILKHV